MKSKAERWLQVGVTVFESEAFRTLPGRELKLWIDLRTQYFGNNNGRLVITLSAFVRRGWKSTDQLLKARDELLSRGLIRRTKYSGRNVFHRATLYAFTDVATAESEKHDITGAPASHDYMTWKEPAICVLRPAERYLTAPRKDSSPPHGKRKGKTSPPHGKRQISRKAAPTLAEHLISPDPTRFPPHGDTYRSSTSVMSEKVAGLKRLNGAHLPSRPVARSDSRRAKKPGRASRAKRA